MQITDIDTILLSCPVPEEETWRLGGTREGSYTKGSFQLGSKGVKADTVIVRVHTDEDIAGIGDPRHIFILSLTDYSDGIPMVSSVDEIRDSIVRAREMSWKNFGRKIWFYGPSFVRYKNRCFRSNLMVFPSISVTGTHCALNCKHCGGRILDTMIQAQTPDKLVRICKEIKEKGGIGCLISGGCLPDGSVPIGRYVEAIAEVKSRFGLKVVIHTGLIDREMAGRLKEVGVDAVLIDIIGSDETAREIYHLDVSAEAYERSLEALSKARIPFVPHVLVGLHYGRLRGEMNALNMIAKHLPSALILIVFFPIRGTEMEAFEPPSPKDVIRVLVQGRQRMPRVPLVLGCARPKGRHRVRTDCLAVEAGVNAIAFPSKEAVERAESLGLEISFSQLCCSQIYEDISAI